MALALREQTFDANGTTINYAEGPAEGPPLVLLHGGSARWQSVESLILALGTRYHIFAPDLRGHGKSAWTPGRYAVADFADDVCALLKERVGEPAFLFGHSLGGIAGLMASAHCPQHVRALAVGDAPIDGRSWIALLTETRLRLEAWRAVAGGQRTIPELIEFLKDSPTEVRGRPGTVPLREVMGEENPVYGWLAGNLSQHDPAVLDMLIERPDEAAEGYSMATLLPRLRQPVLLLQADPAAGGALSDEEVAAAMPLLAHGRHVKIAGLSHTLHNERVEPVAQALADFFASVSASPARSDVG